MLRLTLVVVLFISSDPDLRSLIRDLGDDDPSVRERATQLLEARGPEALDALAEAEESPDHEIRCRAQSIMYRIDPTILLKRSAVAQRPLKVRDLGPDQTVGSKITEIDGARFHFHRSGSVIDGKGRGSIIRTEVVTALDGELDWSVAAVRAGRDLPLERCATHSPRDVFVTGDCSEEFVVKIKGIRRWFCDVPVTFTRPREGDRRRVGAFTLILNWPQIELECERPLPRSIVNSMLNSRDLKGRHRQRGELLPPAEPTDEPAIFFPEAREGAKEPEAWCSCPRQPNQSFLPPATRQKSLVSLPPWGARSFDEFYSLFLVLHVPIEEPFELESPPLS